MVSNVRTIILESGVQRPCTVTYAEFVDIAVTSNRKLIQGRPCYSSGATCDFLCSVQVKFVSRGKIVYKSNVLPCIYRNETRHCNGCRWQLCLDLATIY